MIDPTGLKEAGKVLKQALYADGDTCNYTPAYFEFVASNVIGAYLTTRSGSSEFVVVDRAQLKEIMDELIDSVDLRKAVNPSIAATIESLEFTIKAQQ